MERHRCADKGAGKKDKITYRTNMANPKPLKVKSLSKRYKHIRVVPRMPNFAAWIEGVDLTRPISEVVRQELRQALFDRPIEWGRPQCPTVHE